MCTRIGSCYLSSCRYPLEVCVYAPAYCPKTACSCTCFLAIFWQQATRDLQRVSHPGEKERQKRDELYGLAVSQAESRTK